MACITLRPGMSLRLKEQPYDLPDFILEKYQDGFCWIYQQAWGPNVHLRVSVAQIAIPATPIGSVGTIKAPEALKTFYSRENAI